MSPQESMRDASAKLEEAIVQFGMDAVFDHLSMVVRVLKDNPKAIGDGDALRNGIERLTKETEILQDLYLGEGERI